MLVVMGFAFSAQAQKKSQEFNDCMDKAGKIGDSAIAVCYNTETEKVLLQIKDIYEAATKNKAIASWSGGAGMQSGNLRNLFENWLNYRNRFCSFYTVGNSEYLGSGEYNNAKCLWEVSQNHLIEMTNVVRNSNSYLYERN